MPDRRRFVSIVAAWSACAAGALAARADPRAGVRELAPVVWRGVAMGALASMTIVHPDRAAARVLVERCVAEIRRLEAVFSLYRPDSALSRLNARGALDDPPQELLELLTVALALAERSGGAFDPTVQPLYRLYAEHFARPGAAAAGPAPAQIGAVLRRIGYRKVALSAGRVHLQPGTSVTLNGIAQGYVTDRIADLLRAAGLENVLIDLGEARALGHRPDGGAWRAGIADPRDPERVLRELALGADGALLPALATSAGYGTPFGPDPRMHHLFDPHTGHSANHYASVSVAAQRATIADGLSTAVSVIEPARAASLLRAYPSTRAYLIDAAGAVATLG